MGLKILLSVFHDKVRLRLVFYLCLCCKKLIKYRKGNCPLELNGLECREKERGRRREISNNGMDIFKGVSIAQRSTRQAHLLLACTVNLEHLVPKVDLIYVGDDSIII